MAQILLLLDALFPQQSERKGESVSYKGARQVIQIIVFKIQSFAYPVNDLTVYFVAILVEIMNMSLHSKEGG